MDFQTFVTNADCAKCSRPIAHHSCASAMLIETNPFSEDFLKLVSYKTSQILAPMTPRNWKSKAKWGAPLAQLPWSKWILDNYHNHIAMSS